MAESKKTGRTRRKLTVKAIQSFRYEGRQTGDGNWARDVRWDGQVVGLGLRVLPSGEKSFVLSYRLNGRKRLMSLGRFGNVTLEQARKRARAELSKVYGGRDPLRDRQRERLAGTMGELCAQYIAEHASQKKSGQKDIRWLERFVLPRWRAVKAKAITRDDVESLCATIGRGTAGQPGTPYQANRVLELIRTLFNFGRRKGYLDAGQDNPAVGVPRFKEISRKRRLSLEEMPRVLGAIDAEPDIYVRGVFWLYLFTGCRKAELLQSKWDDIRWEPPTLVLRDTKSGEPHDVPLSPDAVKILEELRDHEDERAKDNPYIIPGQIPGKARVNIDKAWYRIRRAAGVEDVHVHDLRRTVGSWLVDEGHTLHLVGKVLHHASEKTTQIYSRLSDDTVRKAVTAHSKRVVGAKANGTQAEVVDISQARKGARR